MINDTWEDNNVREIFFTENTLSLDFRVVSCSWVLPSIDDPPSEAFKVSVEVTRSTS